MAKPKQTEPLVSEAGRAWLAKELAAAEREEARGPNGQGWAYNEARRAGIVERAEFLRAICASVQKLKTEN